MDHRSKCKTIQLLEDNIRKNLDDLGFRDEFLDTTPKAHYIKKNKKISRALLKLKTSDLQKMLLNSEMTSYSLQENICKTHI